MPKPETASAAQAITAQPEPVKNPNEEVCELDTPIVRGNTIITEVTVRKPMAGELRGLALSDLLNLEVNALRKVLPRLTSPALTDLELGRMDPADLLDMGSKVAHFLLKKSAKAEVFLSA